MRGWTRRHCCFLLHLSSALSADSICGCMSLWPSPLLFFFRLCVLFLFMWSDVSLSLDNNENESGASLRWNESDASWAFASSWFIAGSLCRGDIWGLMTGLWNESKSFRSGMELLQLFFVYGYHEKLAKKHVQTGRFAHAHAYTHTHSTVPHVTSNGGNKIPAFHHFTVVSLWRHPARRSNKKIKHESSEVLQ